MSKDRMEATVEELACYSKQSKRTIENTPVQEAGSKLANYTCGRCGNNFQRRTRGKSARGRKPKYCGQCQTIKRNAYTADYRFRERQQFVFMREFFDLMAEADRAGRLAEWLAAVDLQKTAWRVSVEGMVTFPLA